MNKKSLCPFFYFSGTGNTWWVSQRLVDALCARGFNASAFSIEQISSDQVADLIQSATCIGLGFPIYGSDTPRVFRDFVSRLPVLPQEKPVIGYVTQLG